MNLLCRDFIKPLQNRVKKDLPPEGTSFSRAWIVVMPILIYYTVNTLFVMVFAYFMKWTGTQTGIWADVSQWLRMNSTVVSAVINGVGMLVGAGAVYPLFVKETPRIALPAGRKKDVVFLAILGAAVALCFNVLFSLVQFTGGSEAYAQVAEKQFALPLGAGIILYGLVSPLAEEIVFRGLVYNRLRRQFGLILGIIASSAIFGMYHGNKVQALYGFILGIVIAVLYERYGSFLVPVLLHSAANICIYVISSRGDWQQAVLNPEVCLVSGVISLTLFAGVLYNKKRIEKNR